MIALDSAAPSVPSLTERIRAFVEEHYAERISLADVAHALGYTPSHLTHLFRRSTGKPITAWIIERRILAARRLLASTDRTVTSVAEEVGFVDLGHFGRQFARLTGCSPRRYRAMARAGASIVCPSCGTLRGIDGGAEQIA